jgi:hypothetical protein
LPLGLDLSGSVAKIARANEHLKALNSEIDAVLDERKPYIARFDFDKNCCSYALVLCSQYFAEPHLGIILGDFVHNLRSALDYIITALVSANPGALLRASNKFPICDEPGDYKAKAPRMLAGITHGLNEIRALQPFNRTPPQYDPLFLVNFFSNADKHRVISEYYPVLGPMDGGIAPKDGMIKQQVFAPPQQWRPNHEMVIARVYYTPPGPREVRFEGKLSVQIHFAAPAFGKHSKGFAIATSTLKEMSDHVTMIVETFKAL